MEQEVRSIPHPREIEDTYNRVENALLLKLAANQSKILFFLISAAAAALVWFTTKSLASYQGRIFSVLELMIPTQAGMMLVIPLAFIHFYLPASFKKLSLALITFFLIDIAPFSFAFPKEFPLFTRILFYSVLPGTIGLSWLFFRLSKREVLPYKTLATLYIGAFFAFNLFVYLRLFSDALHPEIMYIWQRKLLLTGLWTFTSILRGRRLPTDPNLALNPVHGFRGILWPSSARLTESGSSEQRELWWRGIWNLVLFSLLTLFRVSIFVTLEQRINASTVEHFGFYYIYVIGDVAYYNFIAGSARLFGFRVPDATRFVFLARDPADRWQRGAVYNYAFISEWIFFPLIRIFKKPLIPALVAFFVFFLFHFPINILFGLLHTVGGPTVNFMTPERPWIYMALMIFFVHYVVIVLSRLYWPLRYRKSEPVTRAWISVILTHIILVAASIISSLPLKLL